MNKLLLRITIAIGLVAGSAIGWFLLPQPRLRLADTLPEAGPTALAGEFVIETNARTLAQQISDKMNPVTGAVTLEAWQTIETMTLAELRDFIRALDSHPPLDESERRVLSLASERWATIDPANFLRWLERESRFAHDQSFRERMFEFGIRQLVAIDPEAAVQLACDLSHPDRIEKALRSIMDQLAASHPSLLLELPERSKLNGRLLRNLQSQVVRALAAVDPQAAADYCALSARHAVEGLIELWVAKDPVAAIAWMDTNHGSAREFWSWRNSALERLARTNPAAGLALLESMPGYERNRAISNFAEGWADVDPAAAVEWALTLTNPAARLEGLRALSLDLADDDPALAEALLDAIPNAKVRMKTFSEYSKRRVLNMRAPEPHIEWAEAQKDPERRAVALSAVVGAWTEDAPERAADYVIAADDSEEKDALATVVAKHVQIDGPADQGLDRLQTWASTLASEDSDLAVKKALEVHGGGIPGPVRKALESGVAVETAIEMMRKLVPEGE
ncbi:MAG: hypothetical protein KDN22_01400 [Verrucomicrobiae bacterium]|nr:hypothetical protein [Verrucomicrobiae bacterium]